MKFQLLVIALSLLIFNNCNIQKKNTEEKQNILFIAVDDMNDWAGFLSGHTGMKIHTPNIDHLAASSMIFSNAHTPA
ncbi:MAG: sulfatase, partial [Planctomycetota bacterium]